MISVGTLQESLARKFRGSSLDDVQGISDFSLYREAGSNLLSELDPYETTRVYRFDLFAGITEYAPPDDLKGKKLIDPAPQDGSQGEDFNQTFTKEFRRDREQYKVSVEFVDGDKVLKARAPGRGAKLNVDATASIGAWVAGGGATNLELDTDLRLDDSSTLRFDLGAVGGFVNSSLTPVDLSAHEDSSSFFRKVYLPSGASTVTGISLVLGSDLGDIWTIPGEPNFGSYRDGVNLVRFDWADAVLTGTPASAAVAYEKLAFTTTDAIADVRVGPLSSRLPLPYETPYYSNRLFRNVAGEWLDTPDSEEDSVMLETEAQNIFFYECCRLIAEDLSLDTEAVKFENKLFGVPGKSTGLYGQYKEDKPTEKLKPQLRYIDLRDRKARRGRGFGRR